MRLIDRVRLESPVIPDEIICLVADEVARQIDAMPGDTWAESPPAELYGCVAPPFKRFFVEAETVVELSELRARRAQGHQLVQRGALIDVEPGDGKQRWHWRYVLTPFAWYQPVASAVVTGLHTVNGRIFLHLDEAGYVLDDMERIKTAVFSDEHGRFCYHAPELSSKAENSRCEGRGVQTRKRIHPKQRPFP